MTSGKNLRMAGIETSLSSHDEALGIVRNSVKSYLGREHPDVLVLPEKWVLENYVLEEEKLGEIVGEFSDLSGKYGTIIVPGSFSVIRSGRLFNTSPIISDGKVQGWADKISLFRRELDKYSKGTDIPVFRLNGISLSIAVCYDLDFPYFTKVAIRKGARILLNPSLIVKQFHSMWHIYVRGRSLENRIPILSVNAAGPLFEGGSLATRMQEAEGAILLMETKARNHSLMVEIDYENTSNLIEKRMMEDPGTYSLDKVVDD